MTIRGTSNQSIKTTTKSVLSQGYEVGGGDDTGGVGFPNTDSVEYREFENDSGSLGMVFTKANEHLSEGTPQADRQPL